MKAKMKPGQKPPEPGNYQCQKCNCRFTAKGDTLVCPKCENTNRDELIPIYMENDPEEEEMYSEADWHGGD
jgi:tRNA(Ile2) C34 agmatinyltransferase TiaS